MVDQIASEATIKKQQERSTAYPAIDLESAIEYASLIKKNLGSGPYSRSSVAVGMGYQGITGASAPKAAALVYYGLLVRSGEVYSLSALADRILIETSAEDKQLAIVEAINSPKLFNALIAKYRNSALPTLLSNILVREYGITEKASQDVVKMFRSSLEFAGLLKNGIIIESTPLTNEVAKIEESSPMDNPLTIDSQPEISVKQQDMQAVDINLSDGRARIIVPDFKKMNKEDVKKLKALIDILSNFIDS